jgi:hypothetical protein
MRIYLFFPFIYLFHKIQIIVKKITMLQILLPKHLKNVARLMELQLKNLNTSKLMAKSQKTG